MSIPKTYDKEMQNRIKPYIKYTGAQSRIFARSWELTMTYFVWKMEKSLKALRVLKKHIPL